MHFSMLKQAYIYIYIYIYVHICKKREWLIHPASTQQVFSIFITDCQQLYCLYPGLHFSVSPARDNCVIIHAVPACLLMKDPNQLLTSWTSVTSELIEVIIFNNYIIIIDIHFAVVVIGFVIGDVIVVASL